MNLADVFAGFDPEKQRSSVVPHPLQIMHDEFDFPR